METKDRRGIWLAAKPETYPGERSDLANLAADIAKRPAEDQVIIRSALERYNNEGENDSYSSDPTELINLIQKENLLANSKSIVDLGSGPGDLVGGLAAAYPDKKVLGIDLSPSFAKKFNAQDKKPSNAAVRVGLIDSPGVIGRMGDLIEGSVVSVLTMDRVADPRQLVANMARFKGAKILATILPINPEDDDPARQDNKIIYTRPEMRVVPGKSEAEDREKLLKLLNATWGGGVEVSAMPITGESSGGAWQYTLYVFVKK